MVERLACRWQLPHLLETLAVCSVCRPLASTPLTLPPSPAPVSYYVPDPSKGAAPGVVKDSSDPEIEGKLELLKVGGTPPGAGLCRQGEEVGVLAGCPDVRRGW